MPNIVDIEALPFQKKFLLSEKRYPALVAGIGTGKTFMMLLKVMQFCLAYPDSLFLVVRNEFTDLRDSTMKDFERYFNMQADSNKEVKLANKSTIMFRHGSELNTLKNINLSGFAIEQAEEFPDDNVFVHLRDRLRRTNCPYRQGIIIANANGHNWIWNKWVNNITSNEFDLITASTFDNPHLPADFLQDLRRMEKDAPNHYQQYVLNSFETSDADDMLLENSVVVNSTELVMEKRDVALRILAVDVARYGGDEIVYSVIESRGAFHWEQIHQECLKQKSLMETVGKTVDMKQTMGIDKIIIDDTGLGGGVTDRLKEFTFDVTAFNGGEKSYFPNYWNKRAEGYFKLKELLDKGYLKLLKDDALLGQLMTIRFSYKSDGRKIIQSKDDMRKEGLKSPDRADAIMMAAYASTNIFSKANIGRQPRMAIK